MKISRPAEHALYSIRECGKDDGGDREKLLMACAATLEMDIMALLSRVVTAEAMILEGKS